MISPPLSGGVPIVDPDGTMAQAFRQWTIAVSVGGLVLYGIGSPEGAIEAALYTLYIDITTPTVPVQYRKMLSSIASDAKQGWVVV